MVQEAQCARPRSLKAPSRRTGHGGCPRLANVARARESGLQDCWYHDADLATCPNIRDLILKCTKTHESAQLGLGTQICVIILAIYWGSGRTRTGREITERIVIKQSNAAQKSKNQIPHVIPPYHTTPKKNQNNQNTGSIPGNVPHWPGAQSVIR